MVLEELQAAILTVIVTLWIGGVARKGANDYWLCASPDLTTIYNGVGEISGYVKERYCGLNTVAGLIGVWSFNRCFILGYPTRISKGNRAEVVSAA